MRAKHEHADSFKIKLFGNITNREEIAQRFGHFLIVDIDEPIMHPVMHVGLSCSSFRLRNFIFMMREEKVMTTAMNIKCITQIGHGHSRAFNMPAGTSHTPRAFPCRLSGFLRLPENKVCRVFLVGLDIQTLGSAHLPVFHILP